MRFFYRLLTRLTAKLTAKLTGKPPTLLETNVHGTKYYDCPELLRTYILAVGDQLKLIREATNSHDRFAIAVYTVDDKKLGYIPHRHNRVIANLLDQHLAITASVINIVPHAWDPVIIRVSLTRL